MLRLACLGLAVSGSLNPLLGNCPSDFPRLGVPQGVEKAPNLYETVHIAQHNFTKQSILRHIRHVDNSLRYTR